MAISLKSYVQLSWGIQRDVAMELRHIMKMKTDFFLFFFSVLGFSYSGNGRS